MNSWHPLRVRAQWSSALIVLVACGDAPPPMAAPAPTPVAAPAPKCPEPPPRDNQFAARVAQVVEECRSADALVLAPELDAQAKGAWVGEYEYAVLGTPTSAAFDATFEVVGGLLTGSMRELNSFGDPSWTHLDADATGEVRATREVVFLKTYHTGPYTHSVLYSGQLSADGKTIAGRWMLGGSTRGTFTMRRP
jgi:hypothetical protein